MKKYNKRKNIKVSKIISLPLMQILGLLLNLMQIFRLPIPLMQIILVYLLRLSIPFIDLLDTMYGV
jgi:hypothetical protein